MSVSAISKRYAKALAQIGVEKDMVGQYSEELTGFNSVLASEKGLKTLMESPTFPKEKKQAILSDLSEQLKISEGMGNFLCLLLVKDRLKFLPSIEGEYRKLADDLSGVVRAHIYSASELDGEQQQSIQGGLEKQTGKKVELSVDVDSSLIGGIQAHFGGKVFDGTVKSQLKRIADTLQKG